MDRGITRPVTTPTRQNGCLNANGEHGLSNGVDEDDSMETQLVHQGYLFTLLAKQSHHSDLDLDKEILDL